MNKVLMRNKTTCLSSLLDPAYSLSLSLSLSLFYHPLSFFPSFPLLARQGVGESRRLQFYTQLDEAVDLADSATERVCVDHDLSSSDDPEFVSDVMGYAYAWCSQCKLCGPVPEHSQKKKKHQSCSLMFYSEINPGILLFTINLFSESFRKHYVWLLVLWWAEIKEFCLGYQRTRTFLTFGLPWQPVSSPVDFFPSVLAYFCLLPRSCKLMWLISLFARRCFKDCSWLVMSTSWGFPFLPFTPTKAGVAAWLLADSAVLQSESHVDFPDIDYDQVGETDRVTCTRVCCVPPKNTHAPPFLHWAGASEKERKFLSFSLPPTLSHDEKIQWVW